MRVSQTLLATEKEVPKDAELISHQLMLRAGLIRKVASGIYSWLPTGVKVLRKVEAIVRQEMEKAGATEMLMPSVLPKELIDETDRWEIFGSELLKMFDRHEREYCYGPTHEEVITDIARKEIRSYKQLPLNLYQIQTKFRDEIRPRFGVMRAREFLMKDAYSFHLSYDCLDKTYEKMYQAYERILTRLGLEFRAVVADSGAIGGSKSHEFQVLAEAGEDLIFYSDKSNYAANIEMATYKLPSLDNIDTPKEALKEVATPNVKSIDDLVKFLKIDIKKTLKTIVIKDQKGQLFGICLRGDHSLNETKLSKVKAISQPFEMATDQEIEDIFKAKPGSLGVVNSPISLIVDYSAAVLSDFVTGANKTNQHLTGVNWARDVNSKFEVCDIRDVVEGDLSPCGEGHLKSRRGVEVGHVFQLGDRYSHAMNASILNDQSKPTDLIMGCYGFGVSRVIAAAIEQSHDDYGIIWPKAIAPYDVSLIPMNAHKNHEVKLKADQLYEELKKAGFDVLYDDRSERAGVMFADHDLIGAPHRIVIGPKGLKENKVEYKARNKSERQEIKLDHIIEFLRG